MKRRLFNLIAAVSLALCLAGLVCWLALPDRPTRVLLRGKTWAFTANAGLFFIHRDRIAGTATEETSWTAFGVVGWHRMAGVTTLFAECWLVALVGAPLPTVWLLIALRRRLTRKPPGCCSACGYDLRASKERCPECGTAIPAVPFGKE